MASRVKEDEKNEKIIRGLLKLPENRRCINCNSLGPQYVCTNFWTFVCTNCSGIHREFTHRVKSVSMAKFTSQEVSSLQGGGNQHAKEIYFKEWDQQRNSFPDSSNVDRLRDFIKHVYVDKRYTGERNFDKPPRVKMGDKEDLSENRRIDTYQGGSRSPPYEDTNERRYSEKSSPGGRSDDKIFRYGNDERRSPGYDQESRSYGDYRKSPARPEVINDWRREDRFENGRRFEERRMSDGDLKLEGRSPERPKDLEASSPPIVRPVREILGENVSPLRISEPPKANGGRNFVVSAHTQRTASSSSLGSTDGHQAEPKREKLGSLIDFDADPEPPLTAAVPQTQQTTIAQSVTQPVSSTSDNNWASFDLAPGAKVSQAPSNVNTLDSVLLQLSGPASVPGHISGVPGGAGALTTAHASNTTVSAFSGGPPVAPVGHTPMLPFGNSIPAASPVSSLSMFPSGDVSAAAPRSTPVLPVNSGNSLVRVGDAGQWPSMQHQHPSLFPAGSNHSTAQQFIPPVGGISSNQPWNSSVVPRAQGFLSSPATQAPQAISTPAPGISSGILPQPTPVDVKSGGRKELPVDIFAATYSPFPVPVPGWQTAQYQGMGFPMQYNTAVPMPTFPQSSISTNPFDFNNEPPQAQAPTFPSMASLQGALQNVPPSSGLLRTSSLGTPLAAWMPPQASSYASGMPPQASSYASGMPPQAPSYASPMPPRAYIGQQVPNNMLPPPRHLGIGGFGSEGVAYGLLNPDQQLSGRYSAPTTPGPFSSVGGNPFG